MPHLAVSRSKFDIWIYEHVHLFCEKSGINSLAESSSRWSKPLSHHMAAIGKRTHWPIEVPVV